MKITNACEQYFNAYKELGNWKNNDKWTNAGLVIEVISYFTLVAPLIVLATYTAASLAGRITQKFQPSSLDVKTFGVFQQLHNAQWISIPMISLKQLSELDSAQQKEIVNSFQLEEFKKFITNLGGVDAFLEMLNKVDPNILARVSLQVATKDPISIKYALLNDDEVGAFTLNQLSLPMSNTHVQILKAQLDKLPKSDRDKLLPLDDLSDLTLSAFNSHMFTKDQIDELMNTFGERAINFISEEQIKDFILNNEKMNDVRSELYNALFHCLDTDVNRIRFSSLSHDRVKEVMKKFAGQPRNLLTEDQVQHFFSNLKASELDQTLYNSLFTYDATATNKTRFQLISKEEAADITKKFVGQPRNLLSEDQMKHFFGSLKADEVDQSLYNSLFTYDTTATNKTRFQLISKEEAADITKKFVGQPRNLLSKDQMKHFFGSLKADEVDQSLYNSLFTYDATATNKARFQLISEAEAAGITKKFFGQPRNLLSEDQMKHFFGNLKATEVNQARYNSLFTYDITTTNGARFQLISKEEAADITKKFVGQPRNLLSKDQMKHFFGSLKADEVDQSLYNSLFTYDATATNKARFQLISEAEAAGITKKFFGQPRNLLSEDQMKHFFGNLKATEVNQALYNSLFIYDVTTTNGARFQLISKEEAADIMKIFAGGPRNLLSEEQAKYFFGNLKATEVDQSLYNSLFTYDSKATNKARFQLLSTEQRIAFQDKFM